MGYCKQLGLAGAVLAGAVLVFSGPAAADRLSMQAEQTGARPLLKLDTSTGRFEADATLTIGLDLAATVNTGDGRIMSSELYLKQAGAVAGVVGAAPTEAPWRTLSLAKSFVFAVDPMGPIAQNAVAVCARSALGRDVTMSVPVAWRVKTGRFNFRWIDYGVVDPTGDVATNPDFYSDQQVEETEAQVLVDVRCLGAQVVAATRTAPRELAPAAAAAPARPGNPEPRRTQSQTSGVQLARETVTAADAADKPVCDGGMVRETAEPVRYVCLCPGHTRRVAAGQNAFACERKLATRR